MRTRFGLPGPRAHMTWVDYWVVVARSDNCQRRCGRHDHEAMKLKDLIAVPTLNHGPTGLVDIRTPMSLA